jgi:hypothetical protein
MINLGKISQLSRYDQMQHYRAMRKDAHARLQQFSSTANGLVAVKTSEAIGMGNIVAKVAHQRMSKKV